MKKLSKINSIISSTSFIIKGRKTLYYGINRGEMNDTCISVTVPVIGRPEISTKIVNDNNEFIKGFKVVKTTNGEYAYIRQSDGKLLPFRYDVAGDFNEYGFALVGKNGSVSWIDTSFRYLDFNGSMVQEGSVFCGWQKVSDFSQGTIPLSQFMKGKILAVEYVILELMEKLKNFTNMMVK